MTAFSAFQMYQAIRALALATIKRLCRRLTSEGLASLVGAAIAACASTALAQPTSAIGQSEIEATGATRPLVSMPVSDAGVRTKATAVDLQYYFVPGTAFKPTDSTTSFTSAATGCTHMTGGLNAQFDAPVHLPHGSTIYYVRFYYYDASVGDMALALLETYPAQPTSVLGTMSSQGTAGSGFATSAVLNAAVDAVNYFYMLRWIPTFATNGQQICGARVAYYPPAVASSLCSLDADGNGMIDALSDGILIIRAMFGLTGTSVTNNAIGIGTPSRTTWAQLRDFFNGACGANFSQ